MIASLELLPGVNLRCYTDSRFKQGCLSFQLIRPMAREEAAMNALLPAVLLRGTKQYPDIRAITGRLDDLYGGSVGALVRRIGDYQTTGLHWKAMRFLLLRWIFCGSCCLIRCWKTAFSAGNLWRVRRKISLPPSNRNAMISGHMRQVNC